MAAPNIVGVTTITGKTAVAIATTTATSLVGNSSGSNKVLKVNALYCANNNATNVAYVTVDVFRSGTAYRLAVAIAIPVASTLDIISKAIYLEEGDNLRITATANGMVEAVCSYEEIS